jgi:hypothetical protein
MAPNMLLTSVFLPLEAIRLGRLVTSVREPQSDFLDAAFTPPQEPEATRLDYSDYKGKLTDTAASGFTNTLTQLVSARLKRKSSRSIRVSTSKLTSYHVLNSGAWFQKLVASPVNRAWIEQKNMEGDDIFLIAGYHTMLDATIQDRSSHASTAAADVTVPVAEILTATGVGGVVLPFEKFLDPSVGASREHDAARQETFQVQGEQICAVQYRRLRFKWFSDGDIDAAKLGPNMWQSGMTFRGNIDNVLRVDLMDEKDLADTDDDDEDEEPCDFEDTFTFGP